MTFAELVSEGKAKPTDIGKYIKKWKKEVQKYDEKDPDRITVHDYLGITQEQWERYAVAPKAIASILSGEQETKYRYRTLTEKQQLAADNLQGEDL